MCANLSITLESLGLVLVLNVRYLHSYLSSFLSAEYIVDTLVKDIQKMFSVMCVFAVGHGRGL